MTVPAKYSLTEAHFIIVELEREVTKLTEFCERYDHWMLATAKALGWEHDDWNSQDPAITVSLAEEVVDERDEARGSIEILSSSLAATAESLRAAEADARAWRDKAHQWWEEMDSANDELKREKEAAEAERDEWKARALGVPIAARADLEGTDG